MCSVGRLKGDNRKEKVFYGGGNYKELVGKRKKQGMCLKVNGFINIVVSVNSTANC